ncbi:DUF3040 domain-containing protein [Dermatophilus congolensis]|uniref:DUF3040 domain-containing protein n=1 Tax=Dermatophilus congolensis TaxID=1863 RepID=UPI0003FA65E1|nr:DUF3040 domain-containing protein [Dermatophilus congolensis]
MFSPVYGVRVFGVVVVRPHCGAVGGLLVEEVAMPLSENEQKMLDQMERALYAEDPRFASSMRGGVAGGSSRQRVVVGCVGAVVGLGLVLGGVAGNLIWLGVVGFVAMVGGMAWAFTPATLKRKQAGSAPRRGFSGRSAGGRRASSSGSFSQRLEQRWERRRRENGF